MSVELCSAEEIALVLKKIPQQEPFRFIDTILELSPEHIIAQYRFPEDADFYRGHFPGDPVTPGVILVEAMAQAGLVALGIYLLSRDEPNVKARTLFSDCAVDFLAIVRPGTTVTVKGKKVFWRSRKLKSSVELLLEDGSVAARGTVAGSGVILP